MKGRAMLKFVKKHKKTIITLMSGAAILGFADAAFAMSVPAWETPICAIAHSISGPVAKGVAVIIFAGTGLLLAAGEASGATKLLLQVVFGLSLSLMAVQWLGFINPAGAGNTGGTMQSATCQF
jgi:type IV secretory pathway VirB2 component (pilin)